MRTIRVWWHCLWRTLTPGHRMVTYYARTVSGSHHSSNVCECGFGLTVPTHPEGR